MREDSLIKETESHGIKNSREVKEKKKKKGTQNCALNLAIRRSGNFEESKLGEKSPT